VKVIPITLEAAEVYIIQDEVIISEEDILSLSSIPRNIYRCDGTSPPQKLPQNVCMLE